jgi:hypothetical protein
VKLRRLLSLRSVYSQIQSHGGIGVCAKTASVCSPAPPVFSTHPVGLGKRGASRDPGRPSPARDRPQIILPFCPERHSIIQFQSHKAGYRLTKPRQLTVYLAVSAHFISSYVFGFLASSDIMWLLPAPPRSPAKRHLPGATRIRSRPVHSRFGQRRDTRPRGLKRPQIPGSTWWRSRPLGADTVPKKEITGEAAPICLGPPHHARRESVDSSQRDRPHIRFSSAELASGKQELAMPEQHRSASQESPDRRWE